ncbi:hypothetical protein LV89_04454 [Arcicella aurantiaca]|uniref:Lipoprotein n=1 Tax=Arcicella aurantiaca TaxID=591202 RepID=A0A316DHP8_9BACT|nr:hypothetical protein [Arcicella aurantiaca]PWK17168.1 hypothetical protein LV89_04454 [Arcicella aurantiaca]
MKNIAYFILIFFLYSCNETVNYDKLIEEQAISFGKSQLNEFNADTINLVIETKKRLGDSLEVTYSMIKFLKKEFEPYVYKFQNADRLRIMYLSFEKQNSSIYINQYNDTNRSLRDYYPKRQIFLKGNIVKEEIPNWETIEWFKLQPPSPHK